MVNLVPRHVFTLQLFSVDTFKKIYKLGYIKTDLLNQGVLQQSSGKYVQKGSRGGRP